MATKRSYSTTINPPRLILFIYNDDSFLPEVEALNAQISSILGKALVSTSMITTEIAEADNEKALESIKKIMPDSVHNALFDARGTLYISLYGFIRHERDLDPAGIHYSSQRVLAWYAKVCSESPEQLKPFTEGEFRHTETGIILNNFIEIFVTHKCSGFFARDCHMGDYDSSMKFGQYATPFLAWTAMKQDILNDPLRKLLHRLNLNR